MQHVVAEAGLESMFEIDSAGTAGWHVGKPADARMRRAAADRGIELTSRSRQLVAADLDRFDLVVAMDADNRRDIVRLRPGDDDSRAEVILLSSVLDDGWPEDVPDPYYGGDDGFVYVLDMLEAACPALLERLT